MPDDVGVIDADTEREARKARKRAKLAELALKNAGTFTGFADEDDEARMTEIISAAATKAVTAALEQDARRVDDSKRPAIVQGNSDNQSDSSTSDDDPRSGLPAHLKSTNVQTRQGDKLVNKTLQLPLSPGGLRGHSVEADRVLDEHVAKAIVKAININKFPRNFDSGDFCISRYALAREMFPYEGSRAFAKYAP